MHIFTLGRRGTGVLVAARHLAADVEVDHRVVFLPPSGKTLEVVSRIDGGRAAHAVPRADVIENILRRDVHAVAVIFPFPFNVKRHDADVEFFAQRRGKIAGTVG